MFGSTMSFVESSLGSWLLGKDLCSVREYVVGFMCVGCLCFGFWFVAFSRRLGTIESTQPHSIQWCAAHVCENYVGYLM